MASATSKKTEMKLTGVARASLDDEHVGDTRVAQHIGGGQRDRVVRDLVPPIREGCGA